MATHSTPAASRALPQRLERADAWVAAAFALASAVLYVALRQRVLDGDGPALVQGLLYSDPPYWMHVAILPLARWLAPLSPDSDPSLPLAWIAVLGASGGVAASFLLARRCGVRRGAACVAAALAAVSPGLLFHATVIEVHALHFGAVALAALLTTLLPWRRRWLAAIALLPIVLLLHGTHRTAVLLLPGWTVWAATLSMTRAAHTQPSTDRRDGRMRSMRELSYWGAPLAVGLAAAIGGEAWLRGDTVLGSIGTDSSLIRAMNGGFSPAYVWTDWLWPLCALVPLALAALPCLLRTRDARAWPLLALVLPSVVFFCLWGTTSGGGYALGTLPFVIVLAGIGIERLSQRRMRTSGTAVEASTDARPGRAHAAFGTATLLALVAGQLLCGALPIQREAHAAEVGAGRQRALAFGAALGGDGVVLALDPSALPSHLYDARAREFNFAEELVRLRVSGASPAAVAERLLVPLLAWQQRRPGRVALHLGMPPALLPTFQPYIDALDARCESVFVVQRFEHAQYPLLALRGLRAPARSADR
jgi:hypothetical protein